ALEDAAVVADPFALEQIDLAFLRIDAVLRHQQWPRMAIARKCAEKARITGRYRMEHLHARQPLGDLRELPQRLVHDAHGPEVINERRVRAELPVLVGQIMPGFLRIEKRILT